MVIAKRARARPGGTAARLLVGVALVGDVMVGHATGGWRPVSWLLALVVFPTVLLAAQWVRAAPVDVIERSAVR